VPAPSSRPGRLVKARVRRARGGLASSRQAGKPQLGTSPAASGTAASVCVAKTRRCLMVVRTQKDTSIRGGRLASVPPSPWDPAHEAPADVACPLPTVHPLLKSLNRPGSGHGPSVLEKQIPRPDAEEPEHSVWKDRAPVQVPLHHGGRAERGGDTAANRSEKAATLCLVQQHKPDHQQDAGKDDQCDSDSAPFTHSTKISHGPVRKITPQMLKRQYLSRSGISGRNSAYFIPALIRRATIQLLLLTEMVDYSTGSPPSPPRSHANGIKHITCVVELSLRIATRPPSGHPRRPLLDRLT